MKSSRMMVRDWMSAA